MSRTRERLVAFAAVCAVLVAVGCRPQSPQEEGDASTSRKNIEIVMVTHGQAGDPYWSVVKRGVDQAERDLGVEVSYQAPQTFDIAEMKKLASAAVAQRPDGIALSLPDADALTPVVKKAEAAGIPVVTLDAGEEAAAELGVLTHVGASQYTAGKRAGQRLGKAGARSVACLHPEQGNSSLDLRCEGLAAGLEPSGGSAENVAVNAKDPTDSRQRIVAALESGKYDAVMALASLAVGPMLAAVKDVSFTGKLASFDLSPEILQAIDDGRIDFTVDGQQYLMGYLPVLYLAQYVQYQLTPTQRLTPTGPAFVTKENAGEVLGLAKDGVR